MTNIDVNTLSRTPEFTPCFVYGVANTWVHTLFCLWCREHLSSLLVLSMVSVLLIFLVFGVVLLCVFTFWVSCCVVHDDFRIKTMFGSSLPQLFVGGLMSNLLYSCLVAYCGVWHILWCLFVLLFFFLCLVYPILPVSLDCPFLIASSVFSNV